MTEPKRIRRGDLKRLLDEHQAFTLLLREWPARKIMMDYEKEWDERRQELLEKSRASDLRLDL